MGRVLVRDEEKVPEKGSGDDYTTLCMYLMALNCTLEGSVGGLLNSRVTCSENNCSSSGMAEGQPRKTQHHHIDWSQERV